jgi:large repetitive protein
MRRLVLAAACLALALFGGLAHFSSAAFTASTAVPSNALQVDQISNHFSVTPGSAVQAGTSTPIASGNVDSLSLSFGTVPSARTFTNVFTIKNVSASTQTATISLSSVPEIDSVAFASSSSTTATLAAGASTTLSVVTSSTVAGHGSGTLTLGVSGISWMYRTYSVSIDEAPEAPGAPTAAQKPAGRLDLAWTASSTTTNLAGYNIYRSSGGAYTKLNATPLTTLSYSDTATVDGTSYTYKIRAVSSASPALESVDSSTVTAVADATPPGKPSSVTLTNGGGTGGAYINRGNMSSINVSVTLASGWLSTDTVTLTLSNGGSSVTKTANPSSGTVTFNGIDVSGLGDGPVTLSATSADAAGNLSATQSSSAPKDTAAPAAPSASYVDNSGTTADQITGTAEANASISITGTSSAGGSANGSGAFTIAVAATHGSNGHPINVSYSVTATDAAGNTSGATTVAAADTR